MELEFDIIQEQKYAVGGFVNFITRYPISEETIYLLNEEFDLDKMRTIDAKFEFGLPKELAKYNSPEILKDDVVNFLLAYIKKYSDWYELHKTEIEQFEKTYDSNYYTLFYNMYNGTRKFVERLFKLNEPTEPETQYPEKYSENKYPLIFTNEGYNFYQYLIDNYFIDDFKSQAKHSLVYEYMRYKEMIICETDTQYQSFVNEVYKYNLQRITKDKPNFNKVKTILDNLYRGFKSK